MSLFSNKSTTEDEAKKLAKTAAKKEDSAKNSSMKDLYGKESSVSASVEKKPVASSKKSASNLSGVLIKPLVTEKGSFLATENKYLFMVDINSNKIDIAKAIESVYGIKPVKVNIVNMEGKVKSRGRISGKRKDWKKAIVTLPKGKTIQVYEGI